VVPSGKVSACATGTLDVDEAIANDARLRCRRCENNVYPGCSLNQPKSIDVKSGGGGAGSWSGQGEKGRV
jgi:hypothetical protein